jgi:prepilin-type N-terminal cleavage/methylation domain-containing protein
VAATPLLKREDGFTLIELLIVVLVLGFVLGAIVTVVVNGNSSEAKLNNTFQAQLQAGMSLDKIRRDARCASAITPTGSASSITLTLPSGCSGGGGTVSWCTVGSGTRYALYRKAAASCDSSGTLVADYLTSANAFNYTAPVSGTSLGKLSVDLPVNITPASAATLYELQDTVAVLNTSR